jgi:hypothetical protein
MSEVYIEYNGKKIKECKNRNQALVYVQNKIDGIPFSTITAANGKTFIKLLGCDDLYKIIPNNL